MAESFNYGDTPFYDEVQEKKFQEHCIENQSTFYDLQKVSKNSLRVMFLSGIIVGRELEKVR